MTDADDFHAGFKGGKTRAVFRSITGADLFTRGEDNMTDFKDLEAMRAERQRVGKKRRAGASEDFVRARDLALENGLVLMQHSDVHYSIQDVNAGWSKDLYPGNGRIWSKDREGPFLRLSMPWTLVEVVKAAIKGKDKLCAK